MMGSNVYNGICGDGCDVGLGRGRLVQWQYFVGERKIGWSSLGELF